MLSIAPLIRGLSLNALVARRALTENPLKAVSIVINLIIALLKKVNNYLASLKLTGQIIHRHDNSHGHKAHSDTHDNHNNRLEQHH